MKLKTGTSHALRPRHAHCQNVLCVLPSEIPFNSRDRSAIFDQLAITSHGNTKSIYSNEFPAYPAPPPSPFIALTRSCFGPSSVSSIPIMFHFLPLSFFMPPTPSALYQFQVQSIPISTAAAAAVTMQPTSLSPSPSLLLSPSCRMLKILQVSLACATTAQPGALQHRRFASPSAERGHVFGAKTDARKHSL